MGNASGNHTTFDFVIIHWIRWIRRKSLRENWIVCPQEYVHLFLLKILTFTNVENVIFTHK